MHTPDTPKTNGESAREYARRRATETGRAYIVSSMGHALADIGDNRRLMREELGGIAATYRRERRNARR